MHAFEELEVPENGIAIHWFGQNSFALKDAGNFVLLVDPYFPRQRPAGEFIHPRPPLDEQDLAPDVVLLTHDHGDHTCPESLLRIHSAFPAARFFGPAECILRLKALGIPQPLLTVLAPGQAAQAGALVIHAVRSKPPEGVPQDGIPAADVEHLGYVIDLGPARVYISGDLIKTFAEHAELLEPVIRLNPHIGLLTTHPTEVEFPDFAGSVKMAVKLGLQAAVPAHYGCFINRTFDPQDWADCFPTPGPVPVIIPYNSSIIYRP